jgi:hypothetical protein
MKRIVTGHHADPTSTWTVAEILPEEFDVVKDSIGHIKKKYGFLLELSDDGWREQINSSKSQLAFMSLDEFSMPDEIIEESRKVIRRDLDIATALEARIILLILAKTINEINELSFDEFRVLIDSIRHYCLDLTNVINSSKEELAKAVEQVNKDSKMIGQEKLDEGLNRITTEEHKDQIHQSVQMLYSILEAINQPYEGEKSDTNKIKQTSIN